MTCRGKAAVGLVVAAVLLLTGSVVAWSATIVKDGDPNTIGEALGKPDGSVVTLTCEQVLWRGKSGQSFAVKEWFDKTPQQPRLVVVSTSPLPVESYWSVDITGTIQTFTANLPTGATYQQRVVIASPENVQVYCDPKGKPYPFPLFKGWLDSWAATRPLTMSSSDSAEMIGQLPVLPDTPDAPLPTPGSRDSIKCLPDGARVSLNGAIVFAGSGNEFAIERSDRSFAIWVNSPRSVPAGTLVDIVGTMSTEGGMRLLSAETVTTLDTEEYSLPEYCGMNNRDVWHNLDSIGLDTSALGVRVWGRVTEIDSQHHAFYISDGSTIPTPGVRIKDYTNDTLPSVDDYVAVSGLSGIDQDVPGVRAVKRYSTDPAISVYTTSLMALPGTGTISGTITAAGADGSSVRVYCGKASTTATFSGGTAHYSLNVPYGTYAVTASALGYKTTTKRVRVSSSTENPTKDISMPALERRIDIISKPRGTLADGTSETAVTVIVRDEEGRRFANVPVRWNLEGAALFTADTTTDAVGEAKAVVRRGAAVASASLEVEAGTAISRSNVD